MLVKERCLGTLNDTTVLEKLDYSLSTMVHRKLCEHDKVLILQHLLLNPGVYLRELQEKVYNTTGTWVHVSTICRAIHKLGLTRQRIQRISYNRSEIKRAEFWSEMCVFPPSMLLWVDETGFDNRNLLRKFGYGIRGQPPQDHTLMLRGKHYSAVAVLSNERVEDVYITDKHVNGELFLEFIRRCMLPILMPFDGRNPNSVVIMDNVSICNTD